VTIALDATMIEALETDADHFRWTSLEAPHESAEGRARAARNAAAIEQVLASLSERPVPLMIPKAAIPLVRECAHEGFPVVSDAIEHTGVDPRECARRLIAISDLLDLIGWSDEEEPTEDVDATDHSRTLAAVAPPLLKTLSEVEDHDPDKSKAEEELGYLSEIYSKATAPSGPSEPD
jgi:hypothetical protein